MDHNVEQGLMHFTDYELQLLGEVRSPIDERAVSSLIEETEQGIKIFSDLIDGESRLHDTTAEVYRTR